MRAESRRGIRAAVTASITASSISSATRTACRRVERLEYDPNRSAHMALVVYADGERRYILAPSGV